MNTTDCERLLQSNISILASSFGEHALSAFDEFLACFSQRLRRLFIAWSVVRYKQQHPLHFIEFHADIAFTEGLFTFRQKAMAGKLYAGPSSVKTVVFEFCKIALMARLKTWEREEKHKERFTKDFASLYQETDEAAGRQEDLLNLLKKAMQELSEEDRQIITWRHIDLKSSDEIGRLLAITKESATNRIYRCMEKLRKLVSKY